MFANALLGGAVARSHGLDPVGFAVLAIVSGLGGGIIRDTLLQRGTPVALTDYAYLTTCAVGGVSQPVPPTGHRVPRDRKPKRSTGKSCVNVTHDDLRIWPISAAK